MKAARAMIIRRLSTAAIEFRLEKAAELPLSCLTGCEASEISRH